LGEDNAELARDYEKISAGRQFKTGQQLVKALGIASGERVLDVGCGTGLLAEYIAGIVGPAGHVLGVDPLALRIEMAQRKARDRALAHVEFRVGDANDLSAIPAARFDVVCLNAVFHWLPDKMGPLRGFARALRPGGRIGIGGGAKHQRSPLQKVMAEVLLARPPFAQYPRPRDIVWRVDEHEIRDLLEAAGFDVKEIDVYDMSHVHASADAAVRYAESSSFGNLLAHLPQALRPAARETLVRELAAIAASDGTITQEGRRMIAVASKRH